MRSSRRQGPSIGGRLDSLVDAHYRDRADLNRIRELSLVARTTSALIHELQKERGLSSGLVAGAGRRFVQDLPSQKEKTDEALAEAFEAWASTVPGPRMGALEAAYGEARAALSLLPRLRADVRSEALTPNSVVQQFSGLIDRLLVILAEVPGGSPHPQINLALIALFNFLLAKEYTGQVRALGSAVCAQGGFEPFQHEHFQTLLRRREESLATFFRHAAREQVERWTELQASEAFARWTELRQELEKAGQDAVSRVPDAGEWYRWSTAAIDTMRQAEISLLDGLEDLSLLILADTRSAWEDSQEQPDAREKTLLLRLERTRIRLWEERREIRLGASPAPEVPPETDPVEALLEASAASVDELHRWRRDLDRWDAVIREARERSRQAKILSLDINIEAMRRSDMVAGAQELAQGLGDLAESMEARLEGLKNAADRALLAQDGWHLRATELKLAVLPLSKDQ